MLARGKDLYGGTPWNAPAGNNFAFTAESELCTKQWKENQVLNSQTVSSIMHTKRDSDPGQK